VIFCRSDETRLLAGFSFKIGGFEFNALKVASL